MPLKWVLQDWIEFYARGNSFYGLSMVVYAASPAFDINKSNERVQDQNLSLLWLDFSETLKDKKR